MVFSGTHNVKYLPIFHGSYSTVALFFLVGMRVVFNVFLVIQNTDFFIQISKMSCMYMNYGIKHTRHGIWRCYFTRKLYLLSPLARENMTLLIK